MAKLELESTDLLSLFKLIDVDDSGQALFGAFCFAGEAWVVMSGFVRIRRVIQDLLLGTGGVCE